MPTMLLKTLIPGRNATLINRILQTHHFEFLHSNTALKRKIPALQRGRDLIKSSF